jgi:hypothetical protein
MGFISLLFLIALCGGDGRNKEFTDFAALGI